MKKEDFLKLGLDEEKAEQCEKESLAELRQFIPKTRFDEVNNDKKRLEKEVETRDAQLEELKSAIGNSDNLKQEIEKLQLENKQKEEQYKQEINKIKIDTAVDLALTNAKVRNKTALKALLKDLDKCEFNEDGTVKGLKEQLESLSKAEDSKFLFESNESNKFTGFVPGINNKKILTSELEDYQTRLNNARNKGDTLEVIKIKQEACQSGISLM